MPDLGLAPSSLYSIPLVDRKVSIKIHIQQIMVDLHGMNLQVVQCNGVTARIRRLRECLPQQVCGIELHLLGQLAVEKGNQEDIQLLRCIQVLDTNIAKTDGLALSVRREGDIGLGAQTHPKARAADARTQLGVCLEVDPHTIIVECHLRVFRVDIAGRARLALDVVAAVSGKELLVECAFKGFG